MGFGTEMQGGKSHEALLRVQDMEIRLLETMRRFAASRADADRQYSAHLAKIIAHAQKGCNSDFAELRAFSSVLRAWDTMLNETTAFSVRLRENADKMFASTLPCLSIVIALKKSCRSDYSEQRSKLDAKLLKLREDVSRAHTEYTRFMDRFRLDQARLHDLDTKGKAGSKFDEAKTRLLKSTAKLHLQHNEYCILLQQVNDFSAKYSGCMLPSLLECQHGLYQLFLKHTKSVLNTLADLTDFASIPCQAMFGRIRQDVHLIEPSNGYGTDFIDEFRSELQVEQEVNFDTGLFNDYSGPLKLSQLQVDDLTLDAFNHRKMRLEEEVMVDQESLDRHREGGPEVEEPVSVQPEDEDLNLEVFQCHMDRVHCAVCSQAERAKRSFIWRQEMEEKTVNVDLLRSLLEQLSRPLDDHDDVSPATEAPATENGEAVPDEGLASSASSKGKMLKFTSSFPFYSLKRFRERSNSKVHAKKDDPPDVNYEEQMGEQVLGSAVVGRIMDSYERAKTISSEGASRPTCQMAVDVGIRNAGKSWSGGTPARRVKDEDWFHGVLPREEVQRLLRQDGDFLVRESKNRRTNEAQYVLSVFWNGHRHFIIQGAEELGWQFEGLTYPSIRELVDQQQLSGEPVTSKSQAVMRRAILREDWQLMNDDIQLEMKIGNGNFGEVYRGCFVKTMAVVAVKTCRDNLSDEQRRKFLREGQILRQYSHPNIVSFIGIAAQRQPVMIVMEYVAGGSLLSFLRKHGQSQSKKQLTEMCCNAATGMEYLESHGCIHRDLAARNCLVAESNVVKISDFGMSREEEEYTVSQGMKQIPIKWTAPEALNFGKYTSLCDVWSFGILMWEVFAGGLQPYLGWTNSHAKERVEEGYRLPATDSTPAEIYLLMLRCWEYGPEKRPHFKDINCTLQGILSDL